MRTATACLSPIYGPAASRKDVPAFVLFGFELSSHSSFSDRERLPRNLLRVTTFV
ncbi:MAG: hypothetical protein ACI9BW_002901 [Gammaproteobacteria bacterium]|jgi:hypothetical protein